VSSIDPLGNHFCVNVVIKGINRSIRSPAIIDSGATALFVSKRFVQRHHIICSPLLNTIALHNIDGSKNKAGSLTHFARLTLTIGSWNEPTDFLVTDLSPEDIILGLPWLKKVNPTIDWDSGEMEIPNSPKQFTPSPPHLVEANRSERRAWIKAGIITDASDEIWVCAGYTLSTELAIKAGEGKVKKTFEELVPKEYQCHAKVFLETESHRLPKHQPWDHTIDLKPDAPEILKTKVYPMPINEQKTLDQFIQENLEKGYIIPSKSPMASPIFFVKKKTGDLRLIQDYRKLNSITVKNRYPLPLAMDIVNKLWDAKIFTKFDVRWGYHNVRIKEGDEWKAAFITNQGLFEPRVMFFGLNNSPATFQALMNAIFADLIAEGKVAVYLDDILIWSTTLEEHWKIVHEVLRCLEKHDLYLRSEKCEFEQSHVDYLELVISPGKVSMDPVKVQAV
jgi:predicted aspartyl protease